jgi:hypothetical protein
MHQLWCSQIWTVLVLFLDCTGLLRSRRIARAGTWCRWVCRRGRTMGGSGQRRCTRSVRARRHGTLGVEQVIFARPQAKADQGARIGNRFALPAMIRLVLAHGIFAGLVPCAGGLSAHVVFADQGLLNRLCPLGINLLLPSHLRRLLARPLPCRCRTGFAGGLGRTGRS